jgi:hypothetical protein
MTFRAAFDSTQDWKKKIFLVSMFHNAKKHGMRTWRLTSTAEYFGMSIGFISESLMLVEHWEKIADSKSRNEALTKLRRETNG